MITLASQSQNEEMNEATGGYEKKSVKNQIPAPPEDAGAHFRPALFVHVGLGLSPFPSAAFVQRNEETGTTATRQEGFAREGSTIGVDGKVRQRGHLNGSHLNSAPLPVHQSTSISWDFYHTNAPALRMVALVIGMWTWGFESHGIMVCSPSSVGEC